MHALAPPTLPALLARATDARPDAPAASDARGTLTFVEFSHRVERMAGALAAAGLATGDRVACWMPNGTEYLVACFAAARLGAVAVHINTRFRALEVGDLLRRSRARVLVSDFGFQTVDFAAILGDVAEDDIAAVEAVAAPGAAPRRARGRPVVPLMGTGTAPDTARPEAACLTFTTSGTTAAPKLVLHTQASIANHAAAVAPAIGLDREGAAALAIMPLCGTFGNAFALAALGTGAHVILMDRFDAARAVSLIREQRITHLATTDDVLRRIADEAGARRLDSVAFSGFASFSPLAKHNIEVAAAAGLHPRALYGSSEAQAFFAVAPEDGDVLRDGGVPVSPDAVVRVRDVETGAPMADGHDGELCVGGPSMFAGYLDNDAATRRATTSDGLFRSSDVARLGGRRIFFHHRMGDTLRLGGFLVDPREIESVLETKGVGGAQVVSVEASGKHVAVAFVIPGPNGDADPSNLLAACRRDLASHKVPARIFVVEQFPLTDSPNGQKVQKAILREWACKAMAGAFETKQ